jgi:hypothetical protein
MSVEKIAKDTLNGQPFIATWKRKCDLCFYRFGPEKIGQDCNIDADPTPHELFGFKKGEQHLPRQIDGKEVGNYCPHFLIYTAE